MPIRPNIPWKRYWFPLGGLTNEGFIADPESVFGRHLNPNLCLLDNLIGRRFLVLCGEPGMGKTHVTTDFFSHTTPITSDAALLLVEFRNVADTDDFKDKTFRSLIWNDWIKSDRQLTLVIDGVDEGLLMVRNFVDFLAKNYGMVSHWIVLIWS